MANGNGHDTKPKRFNDTGAEHEQLEDRNDKPPEKLIDDEEVEPEWYFAKFMPGYSPKRMIRFKNPEHYYTAINALGGLAILFYGYDQGVMSQVNLNPNYQHLMGIYPQESNNRNVAALGGIVSVYYGSLIGALVGGSIADRAGRIRAIILGCIVSVIGAVFQASAYNITWMCCARVVTGLGVGAIDAVIPVWSAEVSSHQARGKFIALEFVANIAGLALAYWIEYFAYLGSGPEDDWTASHKIMAWRTPLALQIVFLAVILALIPFFCESPRWLAKVGRVKEAREALKAVRKGDVEKELRGIVNAVREENKHRDDNRYWRMVFPKTPYQKDLRRRVVLAVWLQIMQELVGIGVITVYAVDLFRDAGFSLNLSKLLAGFNNISYMFSVCFAVFTLDRCGRRSTLIWGAVVMAVWLLIGGILDKYANEGGPNQRAYGAGTAAFTFLYTATFGATWLTVPWLYPTEIFPTFVRAKGGAWSVLGWSIGNGVVTMITPFLFQAISYGVLLLLMGLNIFVIPFIYFMYPETAGRPLEDVDVYFSCAKSWNVYKASKECRDAGMEEWDWTRLPKGDSDDAPPEKAHNHAERGESPSSS